MDAGDTAPSLADAEADSRFILPLNPCNGLLRAEASVSGQPGNWTINAGLNAGERLSAEALEDVLVVCHYSVP
jgi:hypothetical protein